MALDKKTAAIRNFVLYNGYTLVRIGATGELACRCFECFQLLPIRVTEPVTDVQSLKQLFFSQHVDHAQTCEHIPVV